MNKRWYALLPLLIVVFCAERISPTNPYDRDYTGGNYEFTATWPPCHDTIPVFFPCTLRCSSTGDDELTAYRYTVEPAGVTASFSGRHDFSETSPLYFTAPGVCTLKVTGIRPNEIPIDSSYPLTIVNPYRIAADAASLLTGAFVKFNVVNTLDSAATGAALSVKWRIKGANGTSPLPYDTFFTFTAKRPDTVTVFATLDDSSGNSLPLDSLCVAVPVLSMPFVSIDDRNLRASPGSPCTILASTANADSLSWHIGGLKIDTTAPADRITLTWPNPTDDTVIVTSKNRFDTRGNSDTVFVQVRSWAFDLEWVERPTTVRARTLSVWEVVTKKGDEAIPSDEVSYRWTVTPDTAPSSTTVDAGRLSLYFDDNPGVTVKIKVDATVGADTYSRTADVSVVADKPVLEIVDADTSIGLGDTARFIVRTRDADGRIVGIYNRIDGDTGAPMSSDTFSFVGKQPGIRTVEFWCIDNDLFSSPVAAVRLLVTSSKPYFLHARIDDTAYINDSTTITAAAAAGNTGGTITQWFWDFGADGSIERTTAVDHIDTVFTEAGSITVRVGCRDDRDYTAETLAVRTITVSMGAPAVSSVKFSPLTCFRGDTVSVRIVASDPNGTVDTLLAGMDSVSPLRIAIVPSAKAIDTTIRFVMNDTGIFRFSAASIDDDGLRSSWIAAKDPATVKKGNPSVKKLAPDTCWIVDPVTYTITASDPNDTVVSYRVQWEPGGVWETSALPTIPHSYTAHGTKQVRIIVIDGRGESSDTLQESVVVLQGKPAASDSAFPDSVWINDSKTYTLSGSDENGTVKQWAIQWRAGDAYEILTSDSSFTHEFSDSGTHVLNAFVLDNDNIPSDTITATVYVKPGAPKVTSVTTDPSPAGIYISDEILFTVKGSDPNDTPWTMMVSWDGNTVFENSAAVSVDSFVFPHTFSRADSGSRNILFRVKDKDGLTDDLLYTVEVKSGAPSIALTSIDTTGNNIFVLDERIYRVRAIDPNGYPRKICVNWDGGDEIQNSLEITVDSSIINRTFTHTYDTTGSPSKNIRFWTIDEDTVRSATWDTTISARKGAPAIWGDTLDTLWVVVDNGYRDYFYKPNVCDTNGTIVRYYFCASSDTNSASYKGPADSLAVTIDESNTDEVAGIRYIYVLDNDGLLRGKQFIIFADSAPPGPSLGSPAITADSVKLIWQNADFKDGDSTQFKVLCDTTTTPATMVKNFGTCRKTGSEFYFWYHPPVSGRYRFKIIARDARGTESASLVSSYFDFSKP